MPCQPPKTNADQIWSYEEYYHGQRDDENRKNGDGLHHWTGAEVIPLYVTLYVVHLIRHDLKSPMDWRQTVLKWQKVLRNVGQFTVAGIRDVSNR